MFRFLIAVIVVLLINRVDATVVVQEEPDLSWLTAQERQWLKFHPRVRVAPTPDYPPFEFWSKEGKFQGIVQSYLNYFANTLDIEFEIVQTADWSENIQLLREKKIDAVSLIVPWENRRFVKVSDPYIVYPAVIVVNRKEMRDLTLSDLAGEKVAVPKGYTGEFYLRRNHPDIDIVTTNGPAEGVRMVATGEVLAYFDGASAVAFVAEKEGLTNLRIAGSSDFIYRNGFGVREDWAPLAEIISKTLQRMTPAQHREFHAEWVTTDFFRRQFYESPRFWWIAVSILSLLFTGTGLVLYWNRRQAALIDELELANSKTEEVNKKLEKARRDAELANEAKSSFIANISHEIRTPMNGVLGMCELLRMSPLDSKQQDYLKLATRSAQNLLGLINDILDYSKIEAGKLELESLPFSLKKLLAEVVGVMRVQAEAKGLKLLDNCAIEVSESYEGDGLRIRQILLNLLSNAIKFTEQGEVRLRVFRGDLDAETKLLSKSPQPPEGVELDSRHLICFEVEDTGAGIPANKIEKLFEPFEQEDVSTTRKHGGTGLGLAICKTLAEMMGGSAYATSIVGRGSVFSFTAQLKPLQQHLTDSIDNLPTGAIEPRRILLAEDGLVNQKVAIGLLEKRGHQVVLAENGEEVLEAWNNGTFDVVLMDIQMPVMDGLTAVAKIREREAGTDRHQYVVALTAHAMSGDHERFIKAGMDAHLSKPFKPADLYNAVERNFGSTTKMGDNFHDLVIPVIDEAEALATTGGDRELAQILRTTCLEETPNMIANAKAAIGNCDWIAARRCGHSMKSSFSAVGAMAAAAKAAELEFVKTDATDEFVTAIESIESEFQRLANRLTESQI